MIVKYNGKKDPVRLIHGKEYEVLAIEEGAYPDDDVSGYLCAPEGSEIVSGSSEEYK